MKIAIVGLGLIGASLGRAIIKFTSHEVYGLDTDESVLKKADVLKAHSRALSADDYKSVDLVLFALNPDVAISEMNRICPLLKDGAAVADTCGNKRVICTEMERLKKQYPSLKFIGTHPMAGREFSGIDYSDADLFKGAYFILVPIGEDSPADLLSKLSLDIGAGGVEICSADRHDEMIAYTSQLAHVVSSCYVRDAHSARHAGYSAGSFADLTRVARLNPEMWTELFFQNKDNLLSSIEGMQSRLEEMRIALKSDDERGLAELLRQGTACKERADLALKEKKNERNSR